MPASELDRAYDRSYAALIAPGGRLVIGRDERGLERVTNFPATLPQFFKAFCALHGPTEAVVSGSERLTFADLDRISDGLAGTLAARGIAQGDRVGIAMRTCTAQLSDLGRRLHGGAEGRRGRDVAQRLVAGP